MRQKLYSVHNMTADYNSVFVKLKYLSKLQQFTSVKATGEEILMWILCGNRGLTGESFQQLYTVLACYRYLST